MSPYSAYNVKKSSRLDRTSGQYFDDRLSWKKYDPLLQPGQIALESDSTRFKIGNGNTRWSELPYYSDGPLKVEEYLQCSFTKGFALEELIQNKHVEVRFTNSKESEAVDGDFYIQPYEQGEVYTLGDVASFKQDEEDNYVQWRSFSASYDEENNYGYRVYSIPSVTIQADRDLDWEQGVEDGYIDINSNYVLKYAGKVGEFEPNTPYRFLDKITVPYEFNHEYIGDTGEETLTLAWCTQDYVGGEDLDFNYFEALGGDSSAYTADVVPWDEEENRATLHIYDPATIMDRTESEIQFMVSNSRNFYVMKQVNGQNTLWYSRWHRQAAASAGMDAPEEMPASYLIFDGNLCWMKETSLNARNKYYAYPPFDLGIEDGATINISTAYGTEMYLNLMIGNLGGANYSSQQVYPSGIGAGSSSEGMKLTWHRALGIWTTENI